MRRVLSLTKKELRTYFNSPIAYIVVTVLLIGIGYFFFQTFFLAGQTSLRGFFRFASWSFLLFAPAITMKLLAEEKKSGTIEILLTLPVREWEAVLGKFLAAWCLLAVYLLVTLAYPITISRLGNLDWGPVVGGYVGLLFLGAAYLAIGLFASAISRNQVVSLIVAFVICLALFLLDLILPFVPAPLQGILDFIGVDTHFQNIGRGVLDTRDLLYYASLTVLFLFLATQVLESRMSDHSAVRRLNKPAYILAAIGTAICVNLFSIHAFARLDLTQDRMFTLSPATREILLDLDDQLLVRCYFSGDLPAPFNNHARHLKDTLEEYRTYSNGRLRFEFVDPGKKTDKGEPDPAALREAEQDGVPRIEVQKLEKDQMVAVKVFMGLALHYHDRTEALPVLESLDNLEYELTSRIAKLVREKNPVVAFLDGQREGTPETSLRNVGEMLAQNYEVRTLDLSKEGTTLEGVDLLVVAGPQQKIPDPVLFAIDQFIMNGGRALFLTGRNEINLQSFMGRPLDDGLGDLLAAYGVTVRPDLVLDLSNQRIALTRAQGNVRIQSLVPFPPFVLVRDLAKDSPVTKNLEGLVLPFVSCLEVKAPEGVAATVIARSSPKTWLFETDEAFLVDPQSLPQPDENDFAGPQPLVVTLEGSFPSRYADRPIPAREEGGAPVAESVQSRSPTTRLAVVGGSLFAHDDLRNRLGLLFFSNLVDWLGQDERMIAVRSRSVTNRPLAELSDARKNAYKYGNMLGLPLAFVALGVVRWRVRLARKRRGYAPPARRGE